MRTVRQAPADYPHRCSRLSETSSNQSSKTKRIENKDEQEHKEHPKNTGLVDRPLDTHGLSALHEQT
jgi:hypothetical protein